MQKFSGGSSDSNSNHKDKAYDVPNHQSYNVNKGQTDDVPVENEDFKRISSLPPAPTSSNMRLRFNRFISNIRG